MEKGENLNCRNLPTLQQLRYLTELEKEDNTRGMIARIAEKCQVSTAPVSRYLKSCCEKGLLTEDYRFTKEGQAWIENYKRILKELPSYFRSIGIPEAQLEANVRDMVENISCYTISTMLTNYKRMQSSHVREKRERLTEQFLREMLPEKIECPVYFMLYRNKEGKMALSMADQGFEKPATLKHNRRGSWLILKRKEMQGFSRINREKMSGHLDTLKYDQEGTLIQAECRDDMIRIPLRAFQFHRRQGGEVRGALSVTMTCSVGRSHMPESTAVLVFWM